MPHDSRLLCQAFCHLESLKLRPAAVHQSQVETGGQQQVEAEKLVAGL